MEYVYKIYWGPGGKEFGVFPTSESAEAFIDSLCEADEEYEKAEFDIEGLLWEPTLDRWAEDFS